MSKECIHFFWPLCSVIAVNKYPVSPGGLKKLKVLKKGQAKDSDTRRYAWPKITKTKTIFRSADELHGSDRPIKIIKLVNEHAVPSFFK